MKARRNPEKILGLNTFDLITSIIPEVGAGGISFKNTIADFEDILTKKYFDTNYDTNIESKINIENFYLTLSTKGKEFEIEIDLFSGKINSMICRKGYVGKLINGFGIGAEMSEFIKADNYIGFDLDHSFFRRYPFDGLIIYSPIELVDSIYTADICGDKIPNFKIECIEILDIEFARKYFKETIFFSE